MRDIPVRMRQIPTQESYVRRKPLEVDERSQLMAKIVFRRSGSATEIAIEEIERLMGAGVQFGMVPAYS